MSLPTLPCRAALLATAVWLFTACAPAAPSPTAPPKPTQAPSPAAPTPRPTEAPAARPAEARPTLAPAQPTQAPAARPAFDEKALAEFYRGKTIKIVVGHGAGGGYDIYSRLFAKYLGKYLPGTPTVIVENMPGAAGMVALNHVYNVAPRDGTVISHSIGSSALEQVFGNPAVQFDMSKAQYLGAPAGDSYVLIVHRRSGVARMEDLLAPGAREVLFGAEAQGNVNYSGVVLVRDVLGARIKLVPGYEGSAKIRLAIDSGEVDGFLNGWDSTMVTSKDKLDSGEWVPLTRFTEAPIKARPDIPGVLSFARSDEQRQLLRFGILLPSQFSRPYSVAPGVPLERVEALRAAFRRTVEDPEFRAEAEKARLLIDPLDGAQLQRLIQEFLAIPAEVKEKLRAILQAPGR